MIYNPIKIMNEGKREAAIARQMMKTHTENKSVSSIYIQNVVLVILIFYFLFWADSVVRSIFFELSEKKDSYCKYRIINILCE